MKIGFDRHRLKMLEGFQTSVLDMIQRIKILVQARQALMTTIIAIAMDLIAVAAIVTVIASIQNLARTAKARV